MTLTLYHAPNSRSVRVRWLLEEMGLPYQLETVQYKNGDVGGEAYKAVHPLQRLPALTDGDVTLYESIACLQYIAEKYGPTPLAIGLDHPEYGHYLQWLQFGEAGIGQYVNMLMGHSVLLPEDRRVPGIARWAAKETQAFLGLFSARGLAGKETIISTGFSLADISVTYMLLLLKLLRQHDALLDEPVRAYWSRMIARPAWSAASRD